MASPRARHWMNLIQLQNHAFLRDLEREIGRYVDQYIHERFHESLDNVTSADVNFGRVKVVLSKRAKFKRQTLDAHRRQHTQPLMLAS